MLKHSIRRALAGATALVLGSGLAVGTAAAANAAVVDPTSQCIVDVIHHDAVTELSHQEYQYKQDDPGHSETFHNEYQYKKTTTVYTVEHKEIKGWYFDSSQSGTTTVGGHVFNGKWVQGDSTTYYVVPDDIVNAAGVNPYAVAQTGNVPLSAYGYVTSPGNNPSPAYRITGIEVTTTPPAGNLYVTHVNTTLYYTGSGDGSVDSADAIYVATSPGGSWTQFGDPKSVSNHDGIDPFTIYYLTGGGSSSTLTDANWTTETPSAPWVQINERKVVDREAVDASDENVYGDCPADPCVSQSSTWFTEADDVPPTYVANGLKFAGPNVPAVGYLHAVSGNLMGVIGTSYTISEASGYHAAFIYLINRYGTTGYATISIEPYMNGWNAGDTGTFTVTSTTKVWTSKIPNPGLGSQSNPATIAQMSAIFPDNALLAQGVHLGTNSSAGQYTVVSGISGCGGVNFVAAPTLSCLANTDEFGENLELPATTGVQWKVNGGAPQSGPVTVPLTLANVTIEAVPAPGYLFGPGTTSWTFEADDEGICQIPTLATFETNLTYTDQVCAAGKVSPATVTVGMVDGQPFSDGYVDYFLDGSLTPMTLQTMTLAPGTHTVTAAPHDPDDGLLGATSWEFTVLAASAICGDLTTLAITGASSPAPWMLLGQLLVVAGLAVMAVRSVRRREDLI